jgi:hypothetical protein
MSAALLRVLPGTAEDLAEKLRHVMRMLLVHVREYRREQRINPDLDIKVRGEPIERCCAAEPVE